MGRGHEGDGEFRMEFHEEEKGRPEGSESQSVFGAEGWRKMKLYLTS